jgi:hypothetical protein
VWELDGTWWVAPPQNGLSKPCGAFLEQNPLYLSSKWKYNNNKQLHMLQGLFLLSFKDQQTRSIRKMHRGLEIFNII